MTQLTREKIIALRNLRTIDGVTMTYHNIGKIYGGGITRQRVAQILNPTKRQPKFYDTVLSHRTVISCKRQSCGKVISIRKSLAKRKKFCSWACRQKYAKGK